MNRLRLKLSIGAVFVIGAALAVGSAMSAGGPSDTSDTLFYSGVLTSPDGTPLDGPQFIQVALYDAPTAGAVQCLLPSAQTEVTNGHFRVALPASCVDATQSSGDLWIELSVGGSSLPRSRVGAVPYALTADTATSVPGGVTTTGTTTVALVSASISASGSVSEDPEGFVNACSNGAAGAYNCGLTSGFFSSKPHCWIQITGANAEFTRVDPSLSSVQIQLYGEDGANYDAPFYLFCKGETAP